MFHHTNSVLLNLSILLKSILFQVNFTRFIATLTLAINLLKFNPNFVLSKTTKATFAFFVAIVNAIHSNINSSTYHVIYHHRYSESWSWSIFNKVLLAKSYICCDSFIKSSISSFTSHHSHSIFLWVFQYLYLNLKNQSQKKAIENWYMKLKTKDKKVKIYTWDTIKVPTYYGTNDGKKWMKKGIQNVLLFEN